MGSNLNNIFDDFSHNSKTKILEYFKDSKNKKGPIPQAKIKKFFELNKTIQNEIENFIDENEYISSISIFFLYLIREKFYTCKNCGNLLKYDLIKKSKYCSNECKLEHLKNHKFEKIQKYKETCLKNYGVDNPQKSKIINEKTKQTCLEKYGVDNVWKSDEIKNKIKITNLIKYNVEYPQQNKQILEKTQQTCLKNYGVKHPLQNNELLEKSKNTCLKNYDVEYPGQSEIVRNKIKQTCLEKYGVEYSLQSEIIKNKIKQTCLEKYGVEYSGQSDSKKEKTKQTCIEKYGVEYSLQSETVRNKIKQTCLEKYGAENSFYLEKFRKSKNKSWNKILSWSNYILPNFSFEEFTGYKENKEYEWKCVKCGNIFKQRYYHTSFNEEDSLLPRCLKCYPFNTNFSNSEKELVEFCKQYFPSLKENDRKLIKPLELDIVIDELKLAIEFNGLFYHSLNFKEIGYHLNKVLKCNEKCYRLIHIWEDEWNSNNDLIKQKLIDVFTNKEIIDYSKPLDRSWYNNLSGNFEELAPEIITKENIKIENCGYLRKID